MPSKKIKPPKGTRDLYPEDLLRQRYITNAWRDASIRCGFEEIAGPTFESTNLYAVKSGEGILNELFQAFSGKSDKEIEQVQQTGTAPYALRPEFTPTLARMYAARSKELPKPCKWFTAGPYFRAERPQRGRLREFLQWNVDVIGLPDTPDSQHSTDSEIIEVCARLLQSLGLTAHDVQIAVSDRNAMNRLLEEAGVPDSQIETASMLLDRRAKIRPEQFEEQAKQIGLDIKTFEELADRTVHPSGELVGEPKDQIEVDLQNLVPDALDLWLHYRLGFSLPGQPEWWHFDFSIARGLAYYTGTVFEALADGERAVAGGGRYDNLIELFGGPPTPACGFGMGDVVLSNLLDDKNLMPSGLELKEAVAKPQASIRPDAFVVPNRESENNENNEANESLVHTLTANLRRGIESEQWLADENRKPWQKNRYSVAPLHARISYKSTRKLNKLRDDAIKQHAKFFIVINDENNAELHNLDTKESLGSFSPNPTAPNYIGKAIASFL